MLYMAVLGKRLLDLMGGENNIDTITHCATRLRVSFVDRSKVDVEAIKSTEGVVSVMDKGGQFQIVIGTNVPSVYSELAEGTKFDRETTSVEEDTNNDRTSDGKDQKKNLFNTFVEIVVSIFSPILPLFAGAGLLRGLTILAERIGILSADGSTYTILTAAATSVFYFLPLIVAVTTARRFKADPIVAIAVMGALLLPEFQDMMTDGVGTTVSFMGLPVYLADYSSSIIPAILAIVVQAQLEKWLRRALPQSLHMIFVPTIVLFLVVPLTAIVFGPIGTQLSLWIAGGVEQVLSLNGWVLGALIAGIWNILIMFGIHWAVNTTVVIPNIATTGSSQIIALSAAGNFGMAGAALGTFFIAKNKELKNFSLTAIASVFLSGIVEPAIYGVGLKYKTPLIAGIIGSAAGGAFMGGMGTVGFAFVFGGLTTIPAFVGSTILSYLGGLAIAFVVGTVITMLLGIKEEKPAQS